MDAPQDRDIALQRASTDLLNELRTKLPPLLWKFRGSRNEASRQVHRWAQVAKMDRLISLLEPFQEWPQLLDPHLQEILTNLVDAFLAYLIAHRTHYASASSTSSPKAGTLYPLPRAICKLLYVLCKVRGVKVISRFLNNEPRYLEPVLRAFIDWDAVMIEVPTDAREPAQEQSMIWEERYALLLWLSHLLLTPFDLATVSSGELLVPYDNLSDVPELSSQTPKVARSILSICLRYIVLPGKERDAATGLLARLVLRPDMQRLGLLNSLTQWAISSLRPKTGKVLPSVYTYIGVLSFISKLCASGQVDDLAPIAMSLFKTILQLAEEESEISQLINSSALARKVKIKILRTLTTLILSLAERPGSQVSEDTFSMVLENSIDYFLVSLTDNDTPVRLAASKALSIITMKLDPSLATDVIDAVLGSLEENILFEKRDGTLLTRFELEGVDVGERKRNLSGVDPQRWQGLILTLAHLLFRRSPPTGQLAQVLQSLVSALDFEQRSPTGSSVGTNVRDAACFGIWALSRKYTTQELRDLDAQELKVTTNQEDGSTLQALAVELVCAACLDPSGNIRRGSSAALQELIGRHPDTVQEGISLVQAVDYHAVARRSRAMVEVTKAASALGTVYWTPIIHGLLQWRGIGSPDAESRRTAASAIGELSLHLSYKSISQVLDLIMERLSTMGTRNVEERHGVFLSLAATVDSFVIHFQSVDVPEHDCSHAAKIAKQISEFWEIFGSPLGPSEEALTLSTLRPDLTAEASSRLISSLSRACSSAISSHSGLEIPKPTDVLLEKVIKTFLLCVARNDDIPIKSSSHAASELFTLLSAAKQGEITRTWFGNIHDSWKSVTGRGQIAALGAVYGRVSVEKERTSILEQLVRCTGEEEKIAKRVSAVKCLAEGVIPQTDDIEPITGHLIKFLNDYTTDRRGDIGSLIRVEAIRAINIILQSKIDHGTSPQYLRNIMSCIVRLAAEKLDKVRFEAWKCLQLFWDATPDFPPLLRKYEHSSEVSSVQYFLQLYTLLQVDWLALPLIKGMVTSASTGTEGLVRAARFALLQYINSQPEHNRVVLIRELFRNLLSILEGNIDDDRYAVPAVEILGFLLDNCPVHGLSNTDINYRRLFNLIQKSHFKSANMLRLDAAVRTYGILWRVDDIRNEITRKMTSLLLHPYPKVRTDVADYLFIETEADQLKADDWSRSPKELKERVDSLRKAFAAKK